MFSTTDCRFQFCSLSTRNKEFSLLILSQLINIIWFCSIVLLFKSVFVIQSNNCSSSKYLDKLFKLCSCRLFTEIHIKAKSIFGLSFTICVRACETIYVLPDPVGALNMIEPLSRYPSVNNSFAVLASLLIYFIWYFISFIFSSFLIFYDIR